MAELHMQWAMEDDVTNYCYRTLRSLEGGPGFASIGLTSIGVDKLSDGELMDERRVVNNMVRFAVSLVGYRLANKLQ